LRGSTEKKSSRIGRVHFAIIGKAGLRRNVKPITQFGIATARTFCAAFQKELTSIALCRLSKGLSSTGSITGSKSLPTSGFSFDRRTYLALFSPITASLFHSWTTQQSENVQ
jgi:hypothetical protein